MTIYCTYLTIYRGNKLPPFYIGYSSVNKVMNGYHGSVKSRKYKNIWENELKESPQLFYTRILSEHDTIGEAKAKETKLQKYVNAHKNPLYINRNIAGESFYLEHHSEETKARLSRRHSSKETRKKISENNCMKNPLIRAKVAKIHIGKKRTEETKEKIRQKAIGRKHSEEAKRLISNQNKGRHLSEETKNKISKSKMGNKHTLGTCWITNGDNNKLIKKEDFYLWNLLGYIFGKKQKKRSFR